MPLVEGLPGGLSGSSEAAPPTRPPTRPEPSTEASAHYWAESAAAPRVANLNQFGPGDGILGLVVLAVVRDDDPGAQVGFFDGPPRSGRAEGRAITVAGTELGHDDRPTREAVGAGTRPFRVRLPLGPPQRERIPTPDDTDGDGPQGIGTSTILVGVGPSARAAVDNAGALEHHTDAVRTGVDDTDADPDRQVGERSRKVVLEPLPPGGHPWSHVLPAAL